MRRKIRGLVSVGLLIFWTVSALSGFVLYLALEGQRSGEAVLFLVLQSTDGLNSIHGRAF